MRAVEHKSKFRLSQSARNTVASDIVNFIGIAPQEDPLLLILELAPKGSLKVGTLSWHKLTSPLQSYFRQNPNAPTDMLVAFTKDACRGMCYLAGRKIIHRDLGTISSSSCIGTGNL